MPRRKNIFIYLKIADILFSITSRDKRVLKIIEKGFLGFVHSGGNASYNINVILRENIDANAYEFGRPHHVSVNNLDGYIMVSGHLFRAWIDRGRQNAEVSIPASIAAFYLFLRFFCVIILSCKKGIIMHACSVAHKGRGYIFSGPPHTGKSTMALISSDKKVLSDDFSIIKKVGTEYRVFPSPFWGKIMPKGKDDNDSYPIRGIYFLNHSDENFTRPFKSYQKKLIKLHKHTVMFPLLKEHCNNFFEIENELIQKIPLFKLYFLPHNSVWRCIDDKKNNFYEKKGCHI